MEIVLREAGPKDIDFCVEMRIEVLLAANMLAENTDMAQVRNTTREYYAKRLGTNSHVELLAFTKNTFIGCGAASIYEVMPTYSNPTGKKAYIMNMYTRPAYRRGGVAGRILHKLVQTVQNMGVQDIQLEATDMGRPLYTKAGFKELQDEMKYIGQP